MLGSKLTLKNLGIIDPDLGPRLHGVHCFPRRLVVFLSHGTFFVSTPDSLYNLVHT